MKNMDGHVPVLDEFVTVDDLEYFANNVLYGIGGEKVDVLTLHKKGDVRYKANMIELKKGSLKKEDLKQVLDYTKWMSQLIFGDDSKESKRKIRPILIGFKATKSFLDYAKEIRFETKKPAILEYYVEENVIKFKKTGIGFCEKLSDS